MPMHKKMTKTALSVCVFSLWLGTCAKFDRCWSFNLFVNVNYMCNLDDFNLTTSFLFLQILDHFFVASLLFSSISHYHSLTHSTNKFEYNFRIEMPICHQLHHRTGAHYQSELVVPSQPIEFLQLTKACKKAISNLTLNIIINYVNGPLFVPNSH